MGIKRGTSTKESAVQHLHLSWVKTPYSFRSMISFALIVLAALSRFLPHADNFTLVLATAAFAGVTMGTLRGCSVVLATALLSDFFLGAQSYPGMIWVYIGLLSIPVVSVFFASTIGQAFSAAGAFFVLSNFGVWLSSGMYSPDLAGLVQCYVLAVPFFWNTLFSTVGGLMLLKAVALWLRSPISQAAKSSS